MLKIFSYLTNDARELDCQKSDINDQDLDFDWIIFDSRKVLTDLNVRHV